MSATTTGIQLAAANKSVGDAAHVVDVITDVENVPAVKQGIQTTLLPFIQKYGSSPFFCIGTYLLAWEVKQHYQLDLDPQATQYICAALGLAAGYVWQKVAMEFGKWRAPVQPTPATPPAP